MSQGKGSSRRPRDVSTDTVADNWARTFGKGETPPADEPVLFQDASGHWVIMSPTLSWLDLSEPDA